jgi:hypothetical protein
MEMGGRSVDRAPYHLTVSLVGVIRPSSMRIVVDLPAPFGPTNPANERHHRATSALSADEP